MLPHQKAKVKTVLVWGDIVHVPSIQFEQPETTWEFDADQEQARVSRLRIMALAADNMHYIAGAHLDLPGVGRITRSGSSFRFDPDRVADHARSGTAAD